MTITSNITAVQNAGAQSSTQGLVKGQVPHDLLSFLGTIIQQIQSGNAAATPAEDSAPSLNGVTEKISALLKKEGLTEADLQNMSPTELTAKIAELLQQNVTLPGPLQGLATQDLAGKIADLLQKNGFAGATSLTIKPTLTSDLLSPQMLQDVAQNSLDTSGLNPDILQALRDQILSGNITLDTSSPDALAKLKADIFKFLNSQGADPAAAKDYLTALVQGLNLNAPVTTATLQTLNQGTSTAATLPTAPAVPVSNDPILMGGKGETPVLGAKLDTAAATSVSAATADALAQAKPSTGTNVTARVAGYSGVNPALINDLANGGGFGSGGFGAQDKPGDTAGLSNLLHPVSADALAANQTFTNYLSADRSLPSPTIQMVNIQLQRGISTGVNSLTFQLDPADLGRMDVKLKFGKDGTVRAHMTVDKPETLALLQKDSHHLQRALQQSGIDADENSISFDLRQDSRQENLENFDGQSGRTARFDGAADSLLNDTALQAQIAVQSYGYISASGVNIMV